MDDLIAVAWRAEEALLTTGVRNDPERLGALLAPEFYEIGQSGRRWSRSDIIAEVVRARAEDGLVSLSEREARLVAADVVLLSYRLEFASSISRRSSLWKQDGAP